MNKLYVLMLVTSLTACGRKETIKYVVNEATSTPAVSAIQRVVDEANEARFNQGQAPLTPGLVCTLYNNTGAAGVFPNNATGFPATLPAAVASWVYIGDVNQPESPASNGLNLVPSALRGLYTADYAVRCSGQIIITESNYHSFTLNSDDAGLLYIDNALVTGLNTLHAPTVTTGSKFLTRGVHTIRIDYMQDSGTQALQLNVAGERFYR